MNKTEPFIQRQLELNRVDINGKPWKTLPKIIWLFWDQGLNKSGLVNRMCIDNIKKNA